jgi:hypothetical protein
LAQRRARRSLARGPTVAVQLAAQNSTATARAALPRAQAATWPGPGISFPAWADSGPTDPGRPSLSNG